MKTIISALISGLLVGLGLSLSGMGDPKNVIGFLDIFGAWNPRLIFVMGGAVIVTTIGYFLILKSDKPFFAEKFHLPTSKDLDAKLLSGAALFGIGWGLSGYCPGPALISLNRPSTEIIVFVIAMALSAILTRIVLTKQAQRDEA